MDIFINNQRYSIDKKNFLNDGASGNCYRLKKENLDLSVKIYHEKDPMGFGEPWFPDEDTLKKLIELSPQTNPILLSQFIVRDENGKYIGCAKDYVDDLGLDTLTEIFSQPKGIIIDYLQEIQEKIPLFHEAGIILDDWNTDNILFGSHLGKEGIYVFDDGNYYFSDDTSSNHLEFNHLIEDLVDNFVPEHKFGKAKSYILNEMYNSSDYLEYLIRLSNNSNTLGEGLSNHVQKIKMKYY